LKQARKKTEKKLFNYLMEKKIRGIPPHEKFPCSCGRSPTGRCIGWHKLTEEEYMEKFKLYNKEKNNV
jgi:hypothetical protein